MSAEPPKERLKRPGTLACLSLLLVVRVGLRLFGCARTIRWSRRLVASARRSVPLDDHIPREYVEAIATAGAFFPGRALCLEQSIALWLLLHRRGHGAVLYIGVQPYRFRAHAWVVVGNAIINEYDEIAGRFAPLMRVP